jgi:hypothetical protein
LEEDKMKTSGLKICLAAIALGLFSTAANAVTFFSVPYDFNAPGLPLPAPGQTLITNFNVAVGSNATTATGAVAGNPVIAPGYTFSWTPLADGGLYIPPLDPGIAAPVPTDISQYFAVLTNGTATLRAPGTMESFSVLLGSLDAYNTISFAHNGVVVAGGSFTGTQLLANVSAPPPSASGNQLSEANNREFYFSFSPSEQVNQIIFQSSGNSFEFDNLYGAVPEPSVWLMLIAGFGLTGAMLRRRGGSALTA